MKMLCLTLAGVVLAGMVSNASAEPKKRGLRNNQPGSSVAADMSRRSVASAQQAETMDDIRANSLDPAGNYRGFPSWARAAFGGPYGSSGRN